MQRLSNKSLFDSWWGERGRSGLGYLLACAPRRASLQGCPLPPLFLSHQSQYSSHGIL